MIPFPEFEKIPVRIIRSDRKTVSVGLARDGAIVARLPLRFPYERARLYLMGQRDWLRKKLVQLAILRKASPQPKSGGKFWYLGQPYILESSDEYFSRIRFDGRRFLISRFKLPWAAELMARWYKERAAAELPALAAAASLRMELRFRKIRITGAAGRWGSCSAKGDLNFSWRLMVAPRRALHYVVIHELSHLRHRDHSSEFWKLVARHAPDWQVARSWLRRHANLANF